MYPLYVLFHKTDILVFSVVYNTPIGIKLLNTRFINMDHLKYFYVYVERPRWTYLSVSKVTFVIFNGKLVAFFDPQYLHRASINSKTIETKIQRLK